MSRRRRSKPNSSTQTATPSTPSPAPRTPAHNAVQDPLNEAHRLAVIASDNGGSVGSALTLLEQAAAKVAERPKRPSKLSPEAMRAEAARMRRAIAEATALEEAAWALRHAEYAAAVLRRRLQRSISAEQRRLELDRRREKGGLYANQPRSEGRPTRLAVDPEAWEVVKARAIRRRTPVGYAVAQLVVDVVSHSAVPAVHRYDRCASQRFIRLIDLDVETWTSFRAMALESNVTTTRLLGVVVEREARRLGWRVPRDEAGV